MVRSAAPLRIVVRRVLVASVVAPAVHATVYMAALSLHGLLVWADPAHFAFIVSGWKVAYLGGAIVELVALWPLLAWLRNVRGSAPRTFLAVGLGIALTLCLVCAPIVVQEPQLGWPALLSTPAAVLAFGRVSGLCDPGFARRRHASA
ncbi:MAG: hypothetical protein H6825_07185 [Planctomycetes bacterium]|nr:hypothetical protein [Planctomycetota bacterium]